MNVHSNKGGPPMDPKDFAAQYVRLQFNDRLHKMAADWADLLEWEARQDQQKIQAPAPLDGERGFDVREEWII